MFSCTIGKTLPTHVVDVNILGQMEKYRQEHRRACNALRRCFAFKELRKSQENLSVLHHFSFAFQYFLSNKSGNSFESDVVF